MKQTVVNFDKGWRREVTGRPILASSSRQDKITNTAMQIQQIDFGAAAWVAQRQARGLHV